VIPRLILFFCAGLVPALAADWSSAEYRCALKIPEHESWIAGPRQALPVGRIIFHSNAVRTNEGIMVTVVPNLPARELAGPPLLKRITATLATQGFTTGEPAQITWMNLPSFEIVAKRRDTIFGIVLGVARATLRGTDLFIVMAYGKGEGDRARDPDFTRVLDTFRFTETVSTPQGIRPGPSAGSYKAAAIASAAAAGLLAVLFFVMLFKTRATRDGA
jgi:hypothetical protein